MSEGQWEYCRIINDRAGDINISDLVAFKLLMQDEHLDTQSVNTYNPTLKPWDL